MPNDRPLSLWERVRVRVLPDPRRVKIPPHVSVTRWKRTEFKAFPLSYYLAAPRPIIPAMPNRIRRAASLLELLIALAIIGGLAGLILTAAMMVLNKALHILD
jgi:hypothetical protein